MTHTNTYFEQGNTRYVILDGQYCASLDDCYTTLQAQLSIPDYFGNNLDALEEVLADLEWITNTQIIFLVLNSVQLLENDVSAKATFLDILQLCDNPKIAFLYA